MKTIKPSAIIAHMVGSSKLSRYEVSRKLGRNNEYVARLIRGGEHPRIDNIVRVAAVCGYEIHVIGHGEDITVEVPEE